MKLCKIFSLKTHNYYLSVPKRKLSSSACAKPHITACDRQMAGSPATTHHHGLDQSPTDNSCPLFPSWGTSHNCRVLPRINNNPQKSSTTTTGWWLLCNLPLCWSENSPEERTHKKTYSFPYPNSPAKIPGVPSTILISRKTTLTHKNRQLPNYQLGSALAARPKAT